MAKSKSTKILAPSIILLIGLLFISLVIETAIVEWYFPQYNGTEECLKAAAKEGKLDDVTWIEACEESWVHTTLAVIFLSIISGAIGLVLSLVGGVMLFVRIRRRKKLKVSAH